MKFFKARPRAKRVRVLFILKRHEIYGGYSYSGRASGLKNSAEFVSDMLKENDFKSRVVVVQDNNDIDREVSKFKPDVVFIEALWVVPEKFDVLKKLHPGVKWLVRIHSELPFLAHEGIAISWAKEYAKRGVTVAPNSFKTFDDFRSLGLNPVYLPNFYPDDFLKEKKEDQHCGVLNVGCFGAIRPFKNQLSQAVAAIRFCNENRLALRFHINSGRVEDNGNGILKNLRSLFEDSRHRLVEHDWKSHHEFLHLLDQMDIHLSVSFTETFSIVTADAASRRVPIVTSPEVVWVDPKIMADPTDTEDITNRIDYALRHDVSGSLKRLRKFSATSEAVWVKFLEK
jgi:hypothetical protein